MLKGIRDFLKFPVLTIASPYFHPSYQSLNKEMIEKNEQMKNEWITLFIHGSLCVKQFYVIFVFLISFRAFFCPRFWLCLWFNSRWRMLGILAADKVMVLEAESGGEVYAWKSQTPSTTQRLMTRQVRTRSKTSQTSLFMGRPTLVILSKQLQWNTKLPISSADDGKTVNCSSKWTAWECSTTSIWQRPSKKRCSLKIWIPGKGWTLAILISWTAHLTLIRKGMLTLTQVKLWSVSVTRRNHPQNPGIWGFVHRARPYLANRRRHEDFQSILMRCCAILKWCRITFLALMHFVYKRLLHLICYSLMATGS